MRAVQLLNYRNLNNGVLEFEHGLNAIVGGNAQGKTNLIEALYLALTGLSEASKLEHLIRFGEREAFVGLVLEREDGTLKLEIGLGAGRRQARIDGVHVRTSQLAQQAGGVLVRPEDIKLTLGAPGERRAFLDGLISRLSARYAHLLANYERTLVQRNAVLKHALKNSSQMDELEIWDTRIAELGINVMQMRRRVQQKLLLHAQDAQRALSKQKNLGMNLLETAPDTKEAFIKELTARRREELARGTTVVGPHRDDLILNLDGLSAAEFASRGEARTIGLALRKAEFDLLTAKFGEPPILLIDDFSAELDPERRTFLLELANTTPQAIVSGTEHIPGANRLYCVQHGLFQLTTQGEAKQIPSPGTG